MVNVDVLINVLIKILCNHSLRWLIIISVYN